jgi:hypothetical protein
MFFAYFDESGDSGYDKSPTRTFTLASILVDDSDWLELLDQTVAFRRFLRDNFGIPPRAELKAQWLIHGKGDIRGLGLSFPARMAAYRAALRFQRKCGLVRTFAVVIDKKKIKKRSYDPREFAWQYALERLERFGTAEQRNCHVLPDEGHGDFIRKKLRMMRRFHTVPSAFGPDRLDRKAENIVEDSSDRRSSDSYFIQLADLNAYAAFRRAFPGPNFDGSYWDELGDARIKRVSHLTGGIPGIKLWP